MLRPGPLRSLGDSKWTFNLSQSLNDRLVPRAQFPCESCVHLIFMKFESGWNRLKQPRRLHSSSFSLLTVLLMLPWDVLAYINGFEAHPLVILIWLLLPVESHSLICIYSDLWHLCYLTVFGGLWPQHLSVGIDGLLLGLVHHGLKMGFTLVQGIWCLFQWCETHVYRL